MILYLNTLFENVITSIEYVEKEDLDLINHLSGKKQRFLKLSFKNVGDLVNVRNQLRPIIKKNKEKLKTEGAYQVYYNNNH